MVDARPASYPLGMELINCIELPVLIIDRDLTVAGFNSAAARLLSISDDDIGTRLRSIREPAGAQYTVELCEHVIATGSSHRAEVADGAGSRFSVNIGCHKSSQDINGAVLTFTNVTAFRESLERAIEEREFTKVVLNTIADSLVIVDSDLRIQAANQAFYALFQTSRQESQGAYLYRLGNGGWDIPQLQGLLDPGAQTEDHSKLLECDHEFPGVGRRTLWLSARPLIQGSHSGQTTLITIEDITERQRAERALRESEQRFRVITEAAPIMVWMAGTDKFCFYFNKGWLDFVGRPLEEEVGNGWAEGVHPEDFDRCLQIYVDSFDARQPFGMEYRLRHKSGQYRWILDHGVPRFAPDGSFEGYVGGCLDVHDQKEAAEKLRLAAETLRESEERLRLAQQVGIIGTFEWNIQTNVSRWTPELEAIYGLEPGQFAATEEAWEQLLHPEDRAAASQRVKDSIQTGAPVQAEWRAVWPDGSVHWILGRWQVFNDPSGQPTRMTGVNIDITSRKEAEQAQRRLAAIVESSDDAIIGKNLSGMVITWNPAAERMFGYSAKEMIGRPIADIIPPELHDDEWKTLETIARGERIERQETVRVSRTGERMDVSLTVSPVLDEAGRVVGTASIARDITQGKKTEQALRTTERLASVGRMAATVAHEINNPLEAAINLVYLAKRCEAGEELQSYLDSVEQELDRVSHLTRQTLGFYREAKAPATMKVGSLLDSIISFFGARARNKGIELHAEIRRDPEIFAIAGEIRQVITNLLSNSIDSVESGGAIRIRIDESRLDGQHSPGVRIIVADNGPGIPPSVLPRIFEPFFTTKRDVGTGLGLWVCTNIVQRHRGSIRLKSSSIPGKSWTVFSVVLPSPEDSANKPLEDPILPGTSGASCDPRIPRYGSL